MNTTREQSLAIAKTIQQQLMAGNGKIKVWSWGANSWTVIPNGIQFKVQGFKFKGIVSISLQPNDTYKVELIKNKKVITEFTDVYFDEMTTLIDEKVEYTGINYENDVNNAVYKL
jgi:hypothetical protein